MQPIDDQLDGTRLVLLEKALAHVAWDGWNEKSLRLAAQEAGIEPGLARIAFPRGADDLLHFWSLRLDAELLEKLEQTDLEAMKVRARVTFAVRTRIELLARQKEAAYRAMTYLALPHNAAFSAKLIYRTVDAVWHGIDDRSTDINFYTKRAILAAVYSSTLLLWLGDDSKDAQDSWAFLDRRIENVMTFEKTKAKFRAVTERAPSPVNVLTGLLNMGRIP
jgi:ubiquinone biosynthesis protein COQ9